MSVQDDENARKIEQFVKAGLSMGANVEYRDSERQYRIGCLCMIVGLIVFWGSVAGLIAWELSY